MGCHVAGQDDAAGGILHLPFPSAFLRDHACTRTGYCIAALVPCVLSVVWCSLGCSRMLTFQCRSLGASRLLAGRTKPNPCRIAGGWYSQAHPMEPVYPDDDAVPAEPRYSYAHKGTHQILQRGSVIGSDGLIWPPIQAICDCRQCMTPASSRLD